MKAIDLSPKKLIRKRAVKKVIDTVQTFEPFPLPALAFQMQIRGPDDLWFDYMCEPYEFNPLALAADMAVGNIAMTNAVRFALIAECGYIFPEPYAQLVFH